MMGFVTIYLILVLVSVDVISCCPSGVYLTSSKTIVEENTSVTLICNYKPGQTTVEVIWNSSMYQTEANFARTSDICICTGFLDDTNNYECKCDKDGQLSVVVKNVNRSYNGAKWSCQRISTEPCNEVILNVSVPITKTEIHANDIAPINENSNATFFCSTFSLPAADISWSITNGTAVKMLSKNNRVNIKRRETNTSDKLIKVNETLTYRVDRHVHGWKISCNASTLKGSTVPAIALNLSVVYPPANPPNIHSFINESKFSVIEKGTVNLSCSVEGGNPPGIPIWTCINNNNNVIHKEESDIISDRIATSYLTFTAMRSQVDTCVCRTNHKLSDAFVYVAINVLYGPSIDVITNASVIEGDNFTKTCPLTEGNPAGASIEWIGMKHNFTYSRSHNLKIQNVTRDHDMYFMCKAYSTLIPTVGQNKTVSVSSQFHLNVIYPPVNPPNIHSFINESKVSVIEGKTVNMSCSVEGGNPPGIPIWTCINNNNNVIHKKESDIISDRIATSYLTFTAMRSQVDTCVCRTEHKLSDAFVYVAINVLYIPNKPIIQLQYDKLQSNVTGIVKLLEKHSYTLLCWADANPSPKYTFKGILGFENETLTLEELQTNFAGNYSCVAENVMRPSFETIVTGSNKTTITIDVLYGPSIDVITNASVIEGDNFTKACPLTEGNPPGARVKWIGMKHNFTYSRNHTLSIKNVTRDHDMYFMCKANTTLTPTVGQNKTVSVSSQFHLNVIYEATINSFYTNPNHTVLNEDQTYEFICEVDSNPGATINIEMPNGEKFMERSSYRLKQIYTITSCLDIGRYTCTAVNENANGHMNTSDKDLLVNCTPIPVNATIKDLHRALHSSVTLSFIAMAYPEPTCSWQIQQSNESWFDILSNNTQYAMETSVIEANMTFQCNLTLTNFTKSTGEVFRLNVTNVVGEYVELFTLKPYGKPETPTDFDYVKRTESAIHLSWSPGFNGGIQQFFILEYKTLDSQYWKKINLTDNKDSRKMSHEIDGLASGTTYMFNLSSSNHKGTSEKLSLTVGTKEIAKQTSEVPVSGIIGGITGLIVISVGIGIAVFLYRSRYMTKNAQEDDSGPSIYQNMAFTGLRVRKQNNKKLDKTDTGHSKKIKRKVPGDIEMVINDMEEVDDIRHSQREPDNAEYLNSLDVIADLHRIKISELLCYVRDKTEDSFASEYQNLPQGLRKPCTFARKPENIALNRYNGIYPYDHSRVTVNGDPGFFMNACYISGYKDDKAYIASLGPTTKTTDDFKTFWKMVWNEKSDIIVMLTNLNEPSGMKCEQYWPQFGMEILYGDIRVKSDDEDVFSEYVVRSFTLFLGNGRRKVTQLHYTAWPDKKVPEDVSTMLEFRQKLKATPSVGNGPIIIHCSAGIGRTGTLIAIDRLIDEGRSEFSVNVFECVNSMREQRVKMVQTLDQYIYIHKALVNSLYFDPETVPIEHFHEFLQHTNNNVYSKQFQQLKESVENSSQEQEDSVSRNEQFVLRNRERSDVPDDRNRVRLYYNIQMDRPDYINATYINSFRVKDQFIVAQTPLPCTIVDFIRIMYQENCCCVVVMEDLEEPGMPIGHYLPSDDHELQIKDFIITSAVLESNEQYTVRELKIVSTAKNLEGERSMYHFHFKNWIQGNDTPSDVQQFVHFVKEVNDYSEQLGEGLGRVLVHCLKANERSALYCIVAILMEKMRYERQVNVLNTVRRVRSRRRSALISMEQLKFCYQAVGAYINMLETEERR